MKQKEQKLEELMTGKHVKFKAKISEMDDKYITIIPVAYHDNIDKKIGKRSLFM